MLVAALLTKRLEKSAAGTPTDENGNKWVSGTFRSVPGLLT